MATTTNPWYPAALERRGDPVVLAALASVPREMFGLAIPHVPVVATLIEALDLGPDDRVLEIGTGCGYTAALLSMLAAHVYSIEPDPELAADARDRLDELGFDWIHLRYDDGKLGWLEHAPYDAILVHATATDVPQPLVDQLAIGGRLVIPIGRGTTPRIVRATKLRPAECALEELGPLPSF